MPDFKIELLSEEEDEDKDGMQIELLEDESLEDETLTPEPSPESVPEAQPEKELSDIEELTQDAREFDEPDFPEKDLPKTQLSEGVKDVKRQTALGFGKILAERDRKLTEASSLLDDEDELELINESRITGVPVAQLKQEMVNLENWKADNPDFLKRVQHKAGEALITVSEDISLQSDPTMTPKTWTEKLIRTVPQFVSQVAVGIATGGTGSVAFMGAQIIGGTYENLVAQGVDHEKALAAAVANATVQAPLEALGIGKVTKLFKFKAPIVNKLKQIAASMGTEGVTEFLQQYPEVMTELWAKEPDAKLLDYWNEILDGQNFKDALEAGSIGLVLGAFGGAAGVNSNQAWREAAEAHQKQVKKDLLESNPLLDKKDLNPVKPSQLSGDVTNTEKGQVSAEQRDAAEDKAVKEAEADQRREAQQAEAQAQAEAQDQEAAQQAQQAEAEELAYRRSFTDSLNDEQTLMSTADSIETKAIRTAHKALSLGEDNPAKLKSLAYDLQHDAEAKEQGFEAQTTALKLSQLVQDRADQLERVENAEEYADENAKFLTQQAEEQQDEALFTKEELSTEGQPKPAISLEPEIELFDELAEDVKAVEEAEKKLEKKAEPKKDTTSRKMFSRRSFGRRRALGISETASKKLDATFAEQRAKAAEKAKKHPAQKAKKAPKDLTAAIKFSDGTVLKGTSHFDIVGQDLTEAQLEDISKGKATRGFDSKETGFKTVDESTAEFGVTKSEQIESKQRLLIPRELQDPAAIFIRTDISEREFEREAARNKTVADRHIKEGSIKVGDGIRFGEFKELNKILNSGKAGYSPDLDVKYVERVASKTAKTGARYGRPGKRHFGVVVPASDLQTDGEHFVGPQTDATKFRFILPGQARLYTFAEARGVQVEAFQRSQQAKGQRYRFAEPGKPSTPADLKTEIETRLDEKARKLNLGKIKVVENWKGLPTVEQTAEVQRGDVKGLYSLIDNTVYVIADRHANLVDALITTWHELGHNSLHDLSDAGKLSKDYDSLMDMVAKKFPNQIKEYRKAGYATDKLAAEEVLISLFETRKSAPIRMRVRSLLSKLAQRFGLGKDMNNSELEGILDTMRKTVVAAPAAVVKLQSTNGARVPIDAVARYSLDPAKWDTDQNSEIFGTLNNRLAKELEIFERLFGASNLAAMMPGKLDEKGKRDITRTIKARNMGLEMFRVLKSGELRDAIDPKVDANKLADAKGLEGKERKEYLDEIKQLRSGPMYLELDKKGKPILSNNAKAGMSADFLLGTCQPTTACKECYAAKAMIRISNVRKAFRNTAHILSDPKGWAARVAQEAKRVPKTELQFIRLLGSGDLTSSEQVEAFNELAKLADRPIQIFSRHHDNLSKLKDQPNAGFIRMGSVDAELVDILGRDYLKENMEKRGIANAFLYTHPSEMKAIEQLNNDGALGLVLSADVKLHEGIKDSIIRQTSCPCDANERSHQESCRQCALGQKGCMMSFMDKALDKNGKIVKMTADPAQGEVFPIANFLAGVKENKAGQSPILQAYIKVAVDIIEQNKKLVKLYMREFNHWKLYTEGKQQTGTGKNLKITPWDDSKPVPKKRTEIPIKDVRWPNDVVVADSLEWAQEEIDNWTAQQNKAKQGTFELPGGEIQPPVNYVEGKRVDLTEGTLEAAGEVLPVSEGDRTTEGEIVQPERSERAKTGINVRNEGENRFADQIVDGNKFYETRNTPSLGLPGKGKEGQIGKRVAIIRTGEGQAHAIGEATVGTPIRVTSVAEWDSLRPQHLVPDTSEFAFTGTKYLYPMENPVRYETETPVDSKGIVVRGVNLEDSTQRFSKSTIEGRVTPAQLKMIQNIGLKTTPFREKVKLALKDITDKFATAFADPFYKIKKLQNQKGDVRAFEDAYMDFNLISNFDSILQGFLEDGRLAWKNNWVSFNKEDSGKGGLLKIFENLGDDADLFSLRMLAASAKEMQAKGRQNLFGTDEKGNQIDDTEMIKTLEEATQPAYEASTEAWDAAEKRLKEFNKSVLDIMQAASLIDGETRSNWERENYIPFFRLADDLSMEDVRQLHPEGDIGVKGIKKLAGSKRNVANPIQNLIGAYATFLHSSLKNVARAKAIKTLKHHDLATATSASDTSKDTIELKVKGKSVRYRVGDQLALNAILYLDDISGNSFSNVISAPRRWLTYAVTQNPAFKVANWWRDTLTTATLEKDFIPVWDSVIGAYHAFANTDLAKSYRATGGAFMGAYHQRDILKPTEKAVSKLRKRLEKKRRFWNPIRWLDLYNHLGAVSENSARLGLYARKQKAGATEAQAGFAAMDLLNFNRSGDSHTMRTAAAMLPFFNARIQGLYKLGRAAFGKNRTTGERAKTYIMASAIAFLSLMLFLRNDDDERFNQLRDDEKWNYYHFFDVPALGHVRLPVPFEVGTLGKLPQVIWEQLAGGDKNVKKFLKFAATQVFSLDTPQFMKPIVQQWRNKDAFTGVPIVPQSKVGLEPFMQVSVRTSELAKKLGRAAELMNLPDDWQSPQRIEKFFGDYFSYLSMGVFATADMAFDWAKAAPEDPFLYDTLGYMFGISRFVKGEAPTRRTKYEEKFYDMVLESDKAQKTFNAMRKDKSFPKAEVRAYRDLRRAHIRQRKSLRNVQNFLKRLRTKENLIINSNKSREQKRKEIDELTERRVKKLRETIKKYEQSGG
jgi:hypothetical protein